MRTSNPGVSFIQRMEWVPQTARCGWNSEKQRYFVYKDYKGYPTIGCGHLIRPSEDWSAGLTEQQVTELLATDLGKVERAIEEHIAVPLEQHQYDALISFGFNCGVGALNPENCTFVRMLNRGYYEAPTAAYGLRVWNHSGGKVDAGLTRRRAAECHVWLYPWPEDAVTLDVALIDLVQLVRDEAGAHA